MELNNYNHTFFPPFLKTWRSPQFADVSKFPQVRADIEMLGTRSGRPAHLRGDQAADQAGVPGRQEERQGGEGEARQGGWKWCRPGGRRRR